MLKITDVKTYITNAIECFQEVFIGFESPKTVVIPASRRQESRNKVLKECGIDYKDDLPGTAGEVIEGPLGRQIILYQSKKKTRSKSIMLFGTSVDMFCSVMKSSLG